MSRFLLFRLLGLAATLLVTSFVVYASMVVAPGGSEAVLYGGRTPTAAARAAVRAEYHLDDPLMTRYFHWLGNALHGDFGISIVGHQNVSSRISASIGTTVMLVVYAAILVLVAGILLGLLAALKPGPIDALVTLISSISVGVPSFVAATLAINFFALKLNWFPAYGLEPGFWGHIRSLTLPAAALALGAAALVARVTRATVRDELQKDYVVTATARAVPGRVLIRRHVLRNAATPILAAGGVQIAALFVGTVIVESMFGVPGLGSLLISSVSQKDFATVQAVTLLMVAAFVLTNLVVDLIQAAIDPRVAAAVKR